VNLLVVDDQCIFRSLIKAFADKLDINYFELCNGEGALYSIKTNNIDLVLLDIIMDGKEGLETLVEIKTYFTIPVVMVSSYEHYLDTASHLGADDIVLKPVTYESFVEIINKYGQGKDKLNLRSEESWI
jgi:DNA-binding NarL/FixJ family response regulator